MHELVELAPMASGPASELSRSARSANSSGDSSAEVSASSLPMAAIDVGSSAAACAHAERATSVRPMASARSPA
jgi:hypothetical protein